MEEKALAIKSVGIELIPAQIVELRNMQLETIKAIMKEGVHYGKIPGTPKPSLWQPGAQVLDQLHGYAATFQLLDKVEDWDIGFFHYRYMCRLIRRRDEMTVGEGIGSCNSREKKYREAVYHGKDEGIPVDPRDNVNTFEKMAQKRAHIFATLNATGLSDIFTQDVEDMVDQWIDKDIKPAASSPAVNGKQDHVCPVHNVRNYENKGKGGATWWSHKTDDPDCPRGYCNESDLPKLIEKKQARDAASGTKPPDADVETGEVETMPSSALENQESKAEAPAGMPVKTKTGKRKDELLALKPNSIGGLYQLSSDEFGWKSSKTLEQSGYSDAKDIGSPEALLGAWHSCISAYFG